MSESSLFAADFFINCKHGFNRLSGEAQTCLREALSVSQDANGFFLGRGGQGDLYYTFFGLLLASVTNAKINLKTCGNALSAINFKTLDPVHACIWVRADNLLKLLALPASLRNSAIKYLPAKADRVTLDRIRHIASLPPETFPQSDPLSPYSRFLLSTLYADSGWEIPETDLSSYRLPSGLYSNLKNGIDYGTNATASALFLIPEPERRKTAEALLELQEEDGSFKAAAKTPGGDLLSTGTSVFAINHCGIKPRKSVKNFLRKCFRENGLFAASPEDPLGDTEYSVYALLALGGSP